VIEPSSAAIDEPVRPASRKPIITGPISLVMASPTMGPSTLWLTLRSWSADWTTRTMPTKSDRIAAIGTVSVPTRTSCAAMRARSVARKRSRRQAAASSRVPSPMSWRAESTAVPVRPVMPRLSTSASAAIAVLRRRCRVDEPGRSQMAALAGREPPEQAPVEMAARAGVPAEHPPQGRPHCQDGAICRHQGIHQRRHLTRGPPVGRVAAQHAQKRVERARVPGLLVVLALVPPHDQQAVATMEVEVAVLLVGGAIERPQDEARADAVAVAPAV